jgi:hypothetical protein
VGLARSGQAARLEGFWFQARGFLAYVAQQVAWIGMGTAPSRSSGVDGALTSRAQVAQGGIEDDR